jgi:hypothetical protein
MCEDSIYCHRRFGPRFGGGADLSTSENSDSYYSYSNLGHTYNYPHGNNRFFLAEEDNFYVDEIEVFAITFI